MTIVADAVKEHQRASPSGALLPRDDAARRAELKVMKRVATGLLAVALTVFVVARLLEPAYPWLGFVRATAEASLVGGLADWFAVTALFRKPLGLPIPHTAIIQTQKDRIGHVLANFVQNHFLSREVLTAKLRSMQLTERVARWVSDPEHSTRLARHLAVGVAQAVQTLPESDARDQLDVDVAGEPVPAPKQFEHLQQVVYHLYRASRNSGGDEQPFTPPAAPSVEKDAHQLLRLEE